MDAHCVTISLSFKNEPYICFYPGLQHLPQSFGLFCWMMAVHGECWIGLNLGYMLRHSSSLPSTRIDTLCFNSTSSSYLIVYELGGLMGTD